MLIIFERVQIKKNAYSILFKNPENFDVLKFAKTTDFLVNLSFRVQIFLKKIHNFQVIEYFCKIREYFDINSLPFIIHVHHVKLMILGNFSLNQQNFGIYKNI